MTIENDIELLIELQDDIPDPNDRSFAKRALSRLVEALPRWRDISTAPDNEKILIYVHNAYGFNFVKVGIVNPANYDRGVYSMYDDGEALGMLTEHCGHDVNNVSFASYWMPLPTLASLPEVEKENE